MEKKFSEGLWKITLSNDHQVQISPFVNGEQKIAMAYAWRPELREEIGPLTPKEEMIANAKLICASPELLLSLENLIEGCLTKVDSSLIATELYNAQQAINKALS